MILMLIVTFFFLLGRKKREKEKLGEHEGGEVKKRAKMKENK